MLEGSSWSDTILMHRACNAGYYKFVGATAALNRCISCAATAGYYQNDGSMTACKPCTNKPSANTYYLLARVGGFNATFNGCPW